jgi:hypothetical protein
MTAASVTAQYKGRKYRLLWMGQTKFGQRAHLQFFDGTKDFWVDASLVSVRNGGSNGGSRHEDQVRCRHCGQWTLEGDDWCMACGRADYER